MAHNIATVTEIEPPLGAYTLGKAVWLQQQGSILKKYPGVWMSSSTLH